MPSTNGLIILICSVCLLTGCSSHKRPSVASMGVERIQATPSRPKRGEPIRIMEFVPYFENESLTLLQQRRVATNLLQQPRPQTCSLKLTPPSVRPLASDELFRATEMGVAVVGRIARVAGKPRLTPTASGFFLTDSGALATCWHVVNLPKLIGLTVMTRDGRVCPVRQILAVHTNLDLAILQVEGAGFTPLPIASDIQQGAPIWVLSHPFPAYYMFTSGILSGYYTLEDPKAQVTMFFTTAEFANGSSGGPVLNEAG